MIHAAAPRTHRRRQGDAEFSRSSKRLRRHHTRHSLFTRPQSVEAVADSPVTANLVPRHFRISQPMEDREVPREGAKGDALAASSKPTRPIASVCRNLSLHPALDTELQRIWLRAESTPGRRLEDKRGYKLFEVHQHGEVLLYFRSLRFTP
ncbi:uncharacterized protein LOC110304337 [Mus caroli]|uniref:Uncharacterized protein LOC110304337 n=1 Tax=Mus caroli TaxID=10089 RepID=A0A6P7RJS5_MUSCR|nr:uncharacterized protein LOC110304337 [Mus caroli]